MIIDVSQHNGLLDWDSLKPHIDGAIIRCGYGNNIESQDDKEFQRNVAECIRLNIRFGVYLYSYAKYKEEIDSEVQHVLRLVKAYKDKISLPVFIDVEEPGTESFSHESCCRFCEQLESMGYSVGIYASESWWNSYLNDDLPYIKWVANWSKEPAIKYDYWQYTSTLEINGDYFDASQEFRVNTGIVDFSHGDKVSIIPDENVSGKLYVIDCNGAKNRIWNPYYYIDLIYPDGALLKDKNGAMFTRIPFSKLKRI